MKENVSGCFFSEHSVVTINPCAKTGHTITNALPQYLRSKIAVTY